MAEIRHHTRLHELSQIALGLCVGLVIGIGAWGGGRSPLLAVLLPIVISMAPSRWVATAIGIGYLMGVERTGPSYIGTWFDGNLLIGIAIWLGSSIIGGTVWALSWTSSTRPWRKALASALAWGLTLLPPVAVLAMGHTTVAWGFLLPGWGWFGLGLSVLVPAGVIWAFSEFPQRRNLHITSVAVAGAVLFGVSFTFTPPNTRYIADLVAVSTNWGPARDPFEILRRVEKIGQTVRKLGEERLAAAVIYPESILQTYDPALFPVLSKEVLMPAAETGQTVVLGMDLIDKDGNYQTVATAIYPDGRSATANARQTVPIALWKPWKDSGSFLTDWTASNTIQIKDGVKARIVFCYEEYIPILSLINEAKDEHNLVVVMANTWAAQDKVASAIQALHSEGIASMFGKAILRAENRPKPI